MRTKRIMVDRTCPRCGTGFLVAASQVRAGKGTYCSKACTRQSPLSREERFWSKVDRNGPLPDYAPHLGACWLWVAGKRDHKGYGSFWSGGSRKTGKYQRSHVVAYELEVGPVPADKQLDHLCRVTSCVRPSHLEAVTGAVNCLRGMSFAATNARKIHCMRGHNDWHTDPKGHRVCRECRRARNSGVGKGRLPSRFFQHDGVTLPLTEWSKRVGIKVETLWYRIYAGWNMAKVLTTPVR